MTRGVKYVPTDDNREKVEEMAKFGINQRSISAILGIDEDTLQKHYRHELETSTSKMITKVAATLYEKAVYDKDVTSMIFILKTRGRWRTAEHESLLDSNEKLREQMIELRKELDKKNKKDY